ncbi:MAG TPA: TonB-dependent receptor [Sphingomicrobium sp.]|nr:TonB-dependent receptor [Sphingomicrobium sp.]
MKKYVLFCTAALLPSAVYAQSTGTTTFENQTIVVTGNRDKAIDGVKVTDTTKAKSVLTQEFIARQQPGQSIDDIINYLPGVSFQSNGPYGDAGGTLTIHGFDASRISQTFDGVPMNDSGNYALYSQEQLDPELISEVNVSVGSTDLDSPTASATGGTVNYVLRDPTEQMHARVEGSLGSFGFRRFFGVFDTGSFTKWGTRAFVAASNQKDHNPYDPSSKINKTQLNAKIYQPLAGDDFISLNGFYVRNRGQKFNDVTLATFPTSSTHSSLKPPACTTTVPVPGAADKANGCGLAANGYFGYGFNPSNIFRLHVNSRFTLAPGLILTLEPNYEYTEANGGSAVVATEGFFNLRNGSTTTPIFGYIAGKPYFGGIDLNGDGDTLDTVTVDAPSNTVTHRYGIIANLIYRWSPTQEFRVNYTLDHAKLRQTGEVGLLGPNGRPLEYFPSDDPILDATGDPMEKRNRLSYSILNQVSGEYRGKFLDERLVIDAGVRAPFFSRKLNNFCVAESGGSGFVDCFNDPASQAAFMAAHPTDQLPQARNLKYSRVLPSAGLTYLVAPATQLFANFSEGLQVPSTDALYDAFAFPKGAPDATPKPELSKNFEGGVRYNSRKVKAQLSGWYTAFSNRIEDSLIADPQNPGQFISVFTNLGDVHKYGIDASFAYAPVRQLSLYAFGSLMHSNILDDVVGGACSSSDVRFGNPAGGLTVCTTVGQPIVFQTAGKQESGSPTYTLGGRAQGNFGPLEVGVQAKLTGPRYVNDQNTGIFAFPAPPKPPAPPLPNTEVFPAKTPAYTVVDLDARLSLDVIGLPHESYFQFNVHNLFDKFYVSGFNGTINNSAFRSQFVYVGAPRSITGTLNFAF